VEVVTRMNWKNPTCVHVENPLRALYKKYLLFTIHFKVRIIKLFWLVNFGNIIRSERKFKYMWHVLSTIHYFLPFFYDTNIHGSRLNPINCLKLVFVSHKNPSVYWDSFIAIIYLYNFECVLLSLYIKKS
jgi:hypothetical protein